MRESVGRYTIAGGCNFMSAIYIDTEKILMTGSTLFLQLL